MPWANSSGSPRDALITEAYHGRAFEVDPKGKVVWEYNNYIESEGYVSLVSDVTLCRFVRTALQELAIVRQALRSCKTFGKGVDCHKTRRRIAEMNSRRLLKCAVFF